MVRISAVWGTALLLPCYALVAFTPAADATTVVTSSSSPALPTSSSSPALLHSFVTVRTEYNCGTILGRGPAVHPLPTRTATVTLHRHRTTLVHSTPVSTFTPATSTVQVTTTQTSVVTSTDQAATDTLTVTSTPTSTVTSTPTVSVTTDVVTTVTATTTSTTTLPTANNFTPIQSQLATPAPLSRRVLPSVVPDFHLERRRSKSGRGNQPLAYCPRKHQFAQPKEVDCLKEIRSVTQYQTTILATSTLTVLRAAPTVTVSITATSTSTSVVAPPHVTRSLTQFVPAVTTTSVGPAVTTTSTLTNTVSVTVTATSTAFDACGTNNVVTTFGSQTPQGLDGGLTQNGRLTQLDVSSPVACCQACQTTQGCLGYVTFGSNNCNLAINGGSTCPANWGLFLGSIADAGPQRSYAGNGICGQARIET